MEPSSTRSAALPSWIRVSTTNKSSSTATAGTEEKNATTEKSEWLFRIECARFWREAVLNAEQKAWQALVEDMLSLSSESDTEGENDYPWELLPVTVVAPPLPCRLDRHFLMHQALPRSSTGSGDQSMCSVHLPRFFSNLHQTLDWIWKQCILQEPDPVLQAVCRKQRKRKPKHAPMQDLFLWWASHTQAFDSIRILLEDTGGFAQTRVREDFMTLLQELRSTFGLPIELIVLESPSCTLPHRSPSFLATSVGGVGIRLRQVTPSRQRWMQTFWKTLVHDKTANDNLPLPLHSMKDINRLLFQEYSKEHVSFTQWVQDLCNLMTHFYQATPGSFLWDSISRYPSFSSWFATYKTAKTLLPVQKGTNVHESFQACRTLQTQLTWWWQWQSCLIPLVSSSPILSDNNSPNKTVEQSQEDQKQSQLDTKQILSTLKELYDLVGPLTNEAAPTEADKESDKSTHTIRMERGTKLFQRYLIPNDPALASQQDSSSTDHQPPASALLVQPDHQAITLLLELIILVGNIASQDSHEGSKESESMQITNKVSSQELQQGIWQMISELHDTVTETMNQLYQEWSNTNPWNWKMMKHGPQEMVPQLQEHRSMGRFRQGLVDSLPSPARELHALFQDRLSIPREEWLYLFGGTPMEFVRGVWMLVQMGLVQAKHRRGEKNGGVWYEKVCVVWCSKS